MHEYSIVQSLLNSCEEHVAANNATRVSKVVVKIGVMSGVEPQLLKIAFETFKEASVCENAEYVQNIQPLVIRCKSCNTQSQLDKVAYLCPSCQSLDVEVLDGEDMYLMQLELEDDEEYSL